MLDSLGRDLRTALVAVVAASVVSGPAAVAAVYVANADKVDDKHAVASGATVSQRKGKLVATSARTGRLPNNIVGKAPDANRLDGLDSSELGINGYARNSQQTPFDSTGFKSITVQCTGGTRAVGGGAQTFASLLDPNQEQAPLEIRQSYPVNETTWHVAAAESTSYGYDWWLMGYVICAR